MEPIPRKSRLELSVFDKRPPTPSLPPLTVTQATATSSRADRLRIIDPDLSDGDLYLFGSQDRGDQGDEETGLLPGVDHEH